MATLFTLPREQILDLNGDPYPGAVAEFYEAGTTTPANVYSDSALSTSLGSSVTADSAGRFDEIYLGPLIYKVIIKDSGGTTIYEVDDINALGAAEFSIFDGFAAGRAATIASTAIVYFSYGASSGDKLDGLFVSDPSDTSSSDDGADVIVTNAGLRLKRIGESKGTIRVLAMGQSNMVGSGSGGSSSFDSRVTVWDGTDFSAVTLGSDPFNGDGSNNLAAHFCSRLAEETGRKVELVLIAQGGNPIENWVGNITYKTDTEDRSVNGTNRPRWVELRDDLAACGWDGNYTADYVLWHQGEGNQFYPTTHYANQDPYPVDVYVDQFNYMVDALLSEGFTSENSVIVAGSLSWMDMDEGEYFRATSQLNMNRALAMIATSGVQNFRFASLHGLQCDDEGDESGDRPFRVHLTGPSLVIAGRERYYDAAVRKSNDPPLPFQLAELLTRNGTVGTKLERDYILNSTNTPLSLTSRECLGQQLRVDLSGGSATLYLPDLNEKDATNTPPTTDLAPWFATPGWNLHIYVNNTSGSNALTITTNPDAESDAGQANIRYPYDDSIATSFVIDYECDLWIVWDGVQWRIMWLSRDQAITSGNYYAWLLTDTYMNVSGYYDFNGATAVGSNETFNWPSGIPAMAAPGSTAAFHIVADAARFDSFASSGGAVTTMTFERLDNNSRFHWQIHMATRA